MFRQLRSRCTFRKFLRPGPALLGTLGTIGLVALVAFLHVDKSQGDQDIYSFGGSCPSKGAWTDIALQQTQTINGILNQLKDNPDCKGVVEAIGPDLAVASAELQAMRSGSDAPRSQRLETLPFELQALYSEFAAGRDVGSLLFDRMLESAKMRTSALESLPDPVSNGGQPPSYSPEDAMAALFARTKNATRVGIDAMDRVFKALPAYDQCLIGRPQEGLALMTAAVKLGAAFASSGDGVVNRLGNALASFIEMMRNRKFTSALRKNMETEFWFSVSCLLETSTKNWCDAENAQELLRYTQKEYQRNLVNPSVPADAGADSPLEGYFLMVRELPIIADWLRLLQFNTAPRLGPDADARGGALDSVNEATKLGWQLNAQFNERLIFIQTLTDVQQKRNRLFDALKMLVDRLTDNSNPGTTFYLGSRPSQFIPFYLVGLETIPAACAANNEGKMVMGWVDWMKTGGPNRSFQSFFDEPDRLAQTINDRLERLIAAANQQATAYFRLRLVIDPPNLVNRTLTSQNITVYQALARVYEYLSGFEKRLTNSDTDLALIPSIRDTQEKIRRVLVAYNDLMQLGTNLQNGTLDSKNVSEPLQKAVNRVVDTVFQEFNLIIQRNMTLSNRLAAFIERDFAIRMRTDGTLDRHRRDIMAITQDNLLSKLALVHGVNPTLNGGDLDSAQVVNKRNLESLEQIFSDSMYLAIEELNEISHARPTSTEAMKKLTADRFRRDRAERQSRELSKPGFLGLPNLYGWLMAGPRLKSEHPDFYVAHWDPNRVSTSRDDEFSSFEKIRARFCAQSLAFEGRARFASICKGATMTSFFRPEPAPSKPFWLDLPYDSYLPNAAYDAKIKADPVKSRKRICALQDYYMRNWVQALQVTEKRDSKVTYAPADVSIRKIVGTDGFDKTRSRPSADTLVTNLSNAAQVSKPQDSAATKPTGLRHGFSGL